MTRPARPPAVEQMIHSPANYWFALVTDLLTGVGFLCLGISRFSGSTATGVAAVLGGFLLWGAAEYCGHRWLLHGPSSVVQRAHARHHADGVALISAPAFLGAAVASVVWGLLSVALPSGLAALCVAGLYAGYNYYVLLHHMQHRHRAQFVRVVGMAHLERAHRIHHKRHVVNFGVSTTWWDRVFGTFRREMAPEPTLSRQPGARPQNAPLRVR